MVTYLWTYEYTGGVIHVSLLSTESPKSNNTLVARSIPKVRLGFKYHSPFKEPKLLKEMIDFRIGAGNIQDEPGAPSVRKCFNKKQQKNKIGVYQRDTGEKISILM